MGVCFSEDEKKEKISNAKITKVYNFDNKNIDKLDIDEFIPEETVKLFTAKQNKLSELPTIFFSKIKKVYKINLSYNNFSLFDNILLKYSTSLISIDLSHNNIIAIPDELSSFTSLKELFLNYNSIKEIPNNFSSLQSLETFEISYNQIDTLPNEIVYMNKLAFVDMSHNKIKQIPEENWDKSHIVKIDLSYNDINNIPKDLLGKSQVTRLHLKGNEKLSLKMLRETDGYEDYLRRRKSVKDQGFDYNLDISFSLCGLDTQ